MAGPNALKVDFAEAAARAAIAGWPCALRYQMLPAPHRANSLPPDSAAVYRFRYMHYNPGSSNSNLAKSLLTHRILWPFLGIEFLAAEGVADWIRTNLDRTDFFVPTGHAQVLATLEIYIRARVGSVFEGA